MQTWRLRSFGSDDGGNVGRDDREDIVGKVGRKGWELGRLLCAFLEDGGGDGSIVGLIVLSSLSVGSMLMLPFSFSETPIAVPPPSPLGGITKMIPAVFANKIKMPAC